MRARKAKHQLSQLGGDGINPDAGFFEGAEKLLEVWFDTQADGFKSLRTIQRADIDWLLTFVKCTVISTISCEKVDAYLLSESSLFVYDEMIVLKTCGTTTLLHVVPAFLKLAAEKCNATTLLGLWYSRKNMAKPELQIGLHQNFQDEMTFLDKHLAEKELTGGAYLFGRMNGDHWYLYAMDSPEWEQEVEMTFEILMSDLSQESMRKHFYCDSPDKEEMRRRAKICTRDTGIGELLEGVSIDDSMFYPCGYSMNGCKDRTYYTIHVTPQPQCSYASFETNCRYEDYDTIISKVVNVFKPTRFIVNITSQGTSPNVSKELGEFTRRDWVEYNFGRYTMHMGHFVCVKNYARTPSSINLLDYAMEPEEKQ